MYELSWLNFWTCSFVLLCSAVVDAGTMPWTLETILSQHVASPLALVRQSACVWLLSILRHAGKHPQVQVGICLRCMMVTVWRYFCLDRVTFSVFKLRLSMDWLRQVVRQTRFCVCSAGLGHTCICDRIWENGPLGAECRFLVGHTSLKYSSWASYYTLFCVCSCFHCWDMRIWKTEICINCL